MMSKLGRRVLVFPLPLQGHLNSAFHLASLLYTEGFSITVIQTRYNSQDVVTKYPNFTFHFIEDGLTTVSDLSNPWEIPTALNQSCSEPFRDCLSQILIRDREEDQEPVACLIVDSMWAFAAEVASSFKLPRVTLRTCSLASFVTYYNLPLLRQKGYFPVQDNQLNEPVMELPPLRFKDVPSEQHHERLAKTMERARTSQGYICNTMEELEGYWLARSREELPIPVFSIGPLQGTSPASRTSIHKQDQTCLSWLDKQSLNSVLYVSFGSLASMTKDDFLELAWGLANSKQPFLWVVRPGLVQGLGEGEDIPFPEDYLSIVSGRGKIVSWAPQQDALGHRAVGGFWTHCGWNSILESICEGVPMICMPFFGDQPINARHVSECLKVGLFLDKGAKREEIESVVTRLMRGEEGEEMRKLVANLKEKAGHYLMEGGSSYKSLKSFTNFLLSL